MAGIRAGNERGFSLLEVLIAMAIMAISLTVILMTQSSSFENLKRAERMNIIVRLARNKMIETESLIAGKEFVDVKKEESGEFKEPDLEEFTWKRVIREIEFPSFNFGGGATGEDGESGASNEAEKVGRLLTKNLSDALREVVVTIRWNRDGKTQDFSISTYWVNLNHEFSFSE